MKPYLKVLFSLFFLFISSITGKTLIDKIVASINDEPILLSDMEIFIEKSKSKNFQELFGPISPLVLSNKKNILNLLIEEKIINQHVKKSGLTASEQEVEGQIRAILNRNNISLEQLVARLKLLDINMNEYKESIRRQIERKNLIEREIKPLLQISEAQIRNYYKKDMLPKTKILYRISHILITDNEKRALTIWKNVSNDSDNFEKYVKEYSDDSTSLEKNGDLGFFKLDTLSKEFKDAIKSLQKGEISKPIKTSSGYHIIKITDVKNADFDSLSDDEKVVLRNQVFAEELEKKFSLWIERKKQEAHIKIFFDGE